MTNDPFELKILLEKFLEDNQRIHQKLNNLERHMVNFIYPTQELAKLTSRQLQPLTIDDRGLKGLLKEFRQVQDDFSENINAVNLEQTLSEMKYIGKRMKEIEEALKEIKENGLKKEVRLEFSCDGYELVKKPKGYLPTDDIEKPIQSLQDIIDKLPMKEGHVLINRLGLFGMKKQTLLAISKDLNVSGERIRILYAKALRRLRTKEMQELVKKSGNINLITEVFEKT